MASTYPRQDASTPWLRRHFAYPDASGLRAALLISTPISLGLWAAILMLTGAV